MTQKIQQLRRFLLRFQHLEKVKLIQSLRKVWADYTVKWVEKYLHSASIYPLTCEHEDKNEDVRVLKCFVLISVLIKFRYFFTEHTATKFRDIEFSVKWRNLKMFHQ